MDLKYWLKKINDEASANEKRSAEKIEADNRQVEIEAFNEVYQRFAPKVDKVETNIPKFFSKPPLESDTLGQKLKEEARALFLKKRSEEQLEHNELNNLWNLMEKNGCVSVGEDQVITYAEFKKIGRQAGPKCAQYFTPSMFAKLQHGDPMGRVSSTALFNYVMRKVWLRKTRIGLSLYDVTGNGYLMESDLENYIQDLIPNLPQLSSLEPTFHGFYVCTAVRKFMFFLDPLRTNRIRIQDILTCSFLDSLLELRDDDVPNESQMSNWFSGPSALRVYGQYLNLDKDHNGMLSKKELADYGTGSLTRVFLNRLFQECLTYDGEMDYKTYLDLELALNSRSEPQSLQYLFRILDVDNKGYLDHFSINYFYRGIQEQMKEIGQEPVSYDDVRNEIFDMVKPKDSTKITLKDLLNCGQGDVMVSILIDINGFWSYENREALASEGPEADDADEAPDAESSI